MRADGPKDGIVALQRVLADALLADDPVAFVRQLAEAPGADPALRDIDADGLRLCAMLVTKLRFERLLQGSALAADWFERDGRGFTVAFRTYHREVPPVPADPWQEAAAFAAWCERR